MKFINRSLTCMVLLIAPLTLVAASPKPTDTMAMEIRNKTSYPINVFQGKWKGVVLPDDRFQTRDYKDAAVTISTSTPDATIRFITLSNAKGCKAQTCVLITGD